MYGLPSTRLEAQVAIGAAAVANSMGAKLKPSQLMVDFKPVTQVSSKQGFKFFKAWAESFNRKRSRGKQHS